MFLVEGEKKFKGESVKNQGSNQDVMWGKCT